MFPVFAIALDPGHFICCDCTPEALGDHCEFHYEEVAAAGLTTSCPVGPKACECVCGCVSPADAFFCKPCWFAHCWPDFEQHECVRFRLPDGDCEVCWLASK